MTTWRMALLAGALMVMPVSASLGERMRQDHSEADLVITGVVRKIIARETTYGIDGIKTDYEAQVEVNQVESGKGQKAGDTVLVHWFHVTKPPKQGLFDASGCDYGIREKDYGRFWLEKPPSLFSKKWTLLYNNGFEHLERTKK